ncbi:hypothetical protein CWO89_17260 [Bradyrhizobium sp. Leo170]|nr:hypothetical protein CWO89_17260 [Bradyrhizobium sp. Leo170]
MPSRAPRLRSRAVSEPILRPRRHTHRPNIRRDALEAPVLSGFRTHLMEPELFKELCTSAPAPNASTPDGIAFDGLAQ